MDSKYFINNLNTAIQKFGEEKVMSLIDNALNNSMMEERVIEIANDTNMNVNEDEAYIILEELVT